MPWFVEKRNDKYCVVKGTKESPGETVKCHGTKDKATAHLRAIYSNYKAALNRLLNK